MIGDVYNCGSSSLEVTTFGWVEIRGGKGQRISPWDLDREIHVKRDF